jgi:heme/copper-type cytochrome/quinol oxidase subunit 3
MSHTPGDQPVPHRSVSIAMGLFLASLGVLFAAAMLGYCLVRFSPRSPPAGSVRLPYLLWISSAALIGVSISLLLAVRAVRRERLQAMRHATLIALSMAAAFVALQTPALVSLLRLHRQLILQRDRMYGLLFVMILLHAAHVAGGIVALARVAMNAFRGRYDHENYLGLRSVTWYWHFLDIVWFVMFLTMWGLG